jgi:hypothetical protein
MKSAILLCIFAAGCAAKPTQTAKSAQSVEPAVIVLPAVEEAPPGTMDVDWEPTAPPPPKEVVARKLKAKPEMVSPTRAKGMLFALPSRSSKDLKD